MSEVFKVEYMLSDESHDHRIANELTLDQSVTKYEMYTCLWSVMAGMGIRVTDEEKDWVAHYAAIDLLDVDMFDDDYMGKKQGMPYRHEMVDAEEER